MAQVFTIEWHPYPDTKPASFGPYLITSLNMVRSASWGIWDRKTQSRVDGWDGFTDDCITAWAVMPPAYMRN